MMGLMHLLHEIGDGELELVDPEPALLVLRREGVARTEILEDVRGLRDHQPAGLEERRRKRRMLFARAFEDRYQLILAAAPAGDVDIGCAGLFKSQADKLPAPLNLRPIVKLVAHGFASPCVARLVAPDPVARPSAVH